MKKFGEITQSECPNEISVLITGQRYNKETGDFLNDDGFRDICSTRTIKFTNRGLQDLEIVLRCICDELSKSEED